MLKLNPICGSYRDPSGYVYESNKKIFRTITNHGVKNYEAIRNNGFIDTFTKRGWLITSEEIDLNQFDLKDEQIKYIIEHPKLPYISYPYEWSFLALKSAALFHLDFQMEALGCSVTLSDASAYNVQFIGSKPIFIDLLSLAPYQEGEFWYGHRQFCEQFLNPLLLRTFTGVSHNSWYRGNLEGLPTSDLARLIPLNKYLSWNTFIHVILQAKLQRAVMKDQSHSKAAALITQRKFSINAYRDMLSQLRDWISKLTPSDTGKTVWGDYDVSHSYGEENKQAKQRFIARFIENSRPDILWDLGCNTGEFSELALNSGAKTVIGFDFDQVALDKAFHRSAQKNLNFLPLYLDAANPSPNQGWQQTERDGFEKRGNPNAIMALAFEHHLAIGRNIPLTQVVEWISGLADKGVIEFVEKNDPTVQHMLTLRKDIFDDYCRSNFENALLKKARIISVEKISEYGRRLYWYER
jgi:ribosomal protein L11 methylase PrmA